MKTWFSVDVISGIPFGLIESGNPEAAKLSILKTLKSARIIKGVKLLRFLKIAKMLKATHFLAGLSPDNVDTIEDALASYCSKWSSGLEVSLYARLLRSHHGLHAGGIRAHFVQAGARLDVQPRQPSLHCGGHHRRTTPHGDLVSPFTRLR